MKERPNLTQFMEQLIRALKEEERFSTAHIYQSTLNALRLFCKADVIRFNQMDRSRLKQFESHLRNKGCAWNTVSTYMRTLRSTYNKAVDEGLAEEKPRLFRHVYTGVKANTKRALDAGDMSKLLKAPLPQSLSQSLEKSRAWLTLMFLLRGMPFVDLAYLHKKDLQDSVISYRRHKTGTLLTVEVPPTAMKLIQQYKSMDADSPYLFPILSGNRESKEEYIEYQHALRKLNYDLKQLAVYCSIKFNVSSYTARHTWATLAKYCHFSEQLICDALGHSSTKVTETYLKSFKNDELNKANNWSLFTDVNSVAITNVMEGRQYVLSCDGDLSVGVKSNATLEILSSKTGAEPEIVQLAGMEVLQIKDGLCSIVFSTADRMGELVFQK